MQYGLGNDFTCHACQAGVHLSDRFCRQCGTPVMWSSNGMASSSSRRTGEAFATARLLEPPNVSESTRPSSELIVATYPRQFHPATGLSVRSHLVHGELIVEPEPTPVAAIAAPATLLSHRAIVLGLLLFVGPAALPALWFSPTFSMRSKIITSVIYVGLTILIPLAIMFYWLQIAIAPLMDVLPSRV